MRLVLQACLAVFAIGLASCASPGVSSQQQSAQNVAPVLEPDSDTAVVTFINAVVPTLFGPVYRIADRDELIARLRARNYTMRRVSPGPHVFRLLGFSTGTVSIVLEANAMSQHYVAVVPEPVGLFGFTPTLMELSRSQAERYLNDNRYSYSEASP